MVIRAAMHRRVPGGVAFTRVANAALVPLDADAARIADLGGGAPTTPS
jgi:hypothetical protein